MLWRPIRCIPARQVYVFAFKHAPRITVLGDPPEEFCDGWQRGTTKVFDSETGPLADFGPRWGESCLIWRTEASTFRTADHRLSAPMTVRQWTGRTSLGPALWPRLSSSARPSRLLRSLCGSTNADSWPGSGSWKTTVSLPP